MGYSTSRRDVDILGRPTNIFKKVREYLGMSQDEISRYLGISNRTWWRWENGVIEQPTYENWKKITKLIKKRSHQEFEIDFLKWVIYDKPILTFGRTKEELLKEIEKNTEEFMKSPIMVKVLEENPQFKNLPFREIFRRYTKDKISLNAMVLLNSLPIYPPRRGRPRKIEQNCKKNNMPNLKRKVNIKKTPRGRHKRKGENQRKNEENTSDDGSDDEPPNWVFDEDREATYNLIGFLNLLLKIDLRLNPEIYKYKIGKSK